MPKTSSSTRPGWDKAVLQMKAIGAAAVVFVNETLDLAYEI